MIKLFATDVDGTLTDGCMWYADNGLELKRFHFRDGHGFQLLREAGIKTAVLTSENTPIVQKRADKLKVDYLSMGNHDKLAYMKKLCAELKIDLSEVAYIGDDVNDRELLQVVGYSACPADAHPAIKGIKNIKVLACNGGHGAVREFADMILHKTYDQLRKSKSFIKIKELNGAYVLNDKKPRIRWVKYAKLCLFSKITFGKRRKKYKKKRDEYKLKIKRIKECES